MTYSTWLSKLSNILFVQLFRTHWVGECTSFCDFTWKTTTVKLLKTGYGISQARIIKSEDVLHSLWLVKFIHLVVSSFSDKVRFPGNLGCLLWNQKVAVYIRVLFIIQHKVKFQSQLKLLLDICIEWWAQWAWCFKHLQFKQITYCFAVYWY